MASWGVSTSQWVRATTALAAFGAHAKVTGGSDHWPETMRTDRLNRKSEITRFRADPDAPSDEIVGGKEERREAGRALAQRWFRFQDVRPETRAGGSRPSFPCWFEFEPEQQLADCQSAVCAG